MIVLILVGCTSINTVPLDKSINMSKIIIIENPENKVIDFVPVCTRQFARWGIEAELYPQNTRVSPDDYVFTYWTEREWDTRMFMFKSHIELSKNGKMLASGDYHAIGGMFSLSVTKLYTTQWKMKRVFDQMMRYHPEKPAIPIKIVSDPRQDKNRKQKNDISGNISVSDNQ